MSQHPSKGASAKPHCSQIHLSQLVSQTPQSTHGCGDGSEPSCTRPAFYSSFCERILCSFRGDLLHLLSIWAQQNRLQEPTGRTQVVSTLVDRTSMRAQQLGAEVTRKLQQACDNVAVQTEVSQGALQVSALERLVS